MSEYNYKQVDFTRDTYTGDKRWMCKTFTCDSGELVTAAVDAVTGEYIEQLYYLSTDGYLSAGDDVESELRLNGYGPQGLHFEDDGKIKIR